MSDDLDQRIREMMHDQDPILKASLASDGAGLPTLIEGAFKGGMRHWVWFTYGLSFVLFALSLWLGYQALTTTSLDARVLYASGWVGCWFSVGSLKIWNWMEMNRISHQRDIKRLELALLDLSRHLERRT